MKISPFLLIFVLTTACINSSLAQADPGCLRAIQGKAITDKQAKLLPPSCQEFRKTYLQSLRTLSKDPQKFSHELSKQILAKKSFSPPYNAILISTFPKNVSEELKSAIRKRAKIENEKKFQYRYAAAAEERMEKGSCSDLFSDAAYDEICRGKDLVYERIEKLGAKQ